MTNAQEWTEKYLGYRFNDSTLLEQALTHRSVSKSHNERLEFLGDAVLDTVISHAVYLRRPADQEGDLTRLRALLVRRETLADLGRELDLAPQLKLGPGEKSTGGGGRASLLANAFEAILGAVFLDGGYTATESVIQKVYASRLASLPDAHALKDPKTRLQEVLQARQIVPPHYELTSTTGPAHAQQFEVICRVETLKLEARGNGSSRRSAEQVAAGRLLDQISGD